MLADPILPRPGPGRRGQAFSRMNAPPARTRTTAWTSSVTTSRSRLYGGCSVSGLGDLVAACRAVGHRRRGAAERGADRLVCAPVTDPARAGAPVPVQHGPLDREPQCPDLALGGEQVRLVRLVPHDLAVAQVYQLEQLGHLALGPPQGQRVEPHLEQGPRLELLGGRAAGLVVDDPHLPVGRDVEAVDVAAQPQPG